MIALLSLVPRLTFADTQVYLQGISTGGVMYGFQQLFPTSGSCTVTLYESTYPDTTPAHHVDSTASCSTFVSGGALFNEATTLTSIIVAQWGGPRNGDYWLKLALPTGTQYITLSYSASGWSAYSYPASLNWSAVSATSSLLFQYPPSWKSGTNTPYTLPYLTAGTGTIPWEAIATSSGLYAQDYCAGSTAIAWPICISFSYLFIPQPSAMAQFAGIPQLLSQRFPFSWFYGIPTTLSTLTASSTETFPVYRFQLQDLGVGSTTAIGNILPDAVVLSTSTVSHYLDDSTRQALRALAAAALWLVFAADVFFTVKHHTV